MQHIMTFQRLTIGQHDFVLVSVNLRGGVPLLGNGWHRVFVAHCLALCLGGFACLKVGLRLCHCLIMRHCIGGCSLGCFLSVDVVLYLTHALPVVHGSLCLVNLLLSLGHGLLVLLNALAHLGLRCCLGFSECFRGIVILRPYHTVGYITR